MIQSARQEAYLNDVLVEQIENVGGSVERSQSKPNRYLEPITSIFTREFSGEEISRVYYGNNLKTEHARALIRQESLVALSINSNVLLQPDLIQELLAEDTLREASMHHTNTTDRSLRSLPNSKITELTVAYTSVTDTGVAQIARCKSIRHLDLSGTQVSNDGLKLLRDLPELEILRLVGIKLDRESMNIIASYQSLKSLDIHDADVSDADIQALKSCKTLQDLVLGFPPRVTERGKAALKDSIKGLKIRTSSID